MRRKPEVAVVVATHNRAGTLRGLLAALADQDTPLDAVEIVIVDDGSTDDTPRFLEAAAAGQLPLRTLRLDKNSGAAAGRNAGWRSSQAPLICFTDDDCVPTTGWLGALRAAAGQHPGAIIQGPVAPIPKDAHRCTPLAHTLVVDQLGPFFQTANIAYPRELLESLDGFNEAIHRCEDADLAWRAIAHGASPVWESQALTYHVVHQLGFRGTMRIAWGWHHLPRTYRDHAGLRRAGLQKRVFWKGTHYLLLRAILGVAIRRRHPRLGDWLAWPYLGAILLRQWRLEHGSPVHIPVLVARDVVEIACMIRGSIRARTLML